MSDKVEKVMGTGTGSDTGKKPIKLYSHAGGPNPWKVAIFLNELELPYETELMQFPDLKKDPFEKLNPNGRVPAIEDPNTGMTLWESGAIIEYLLETYDPKGNTYLLFQDISESCLGASPSVRTETQDADTLLRSIPLIVLTTIYWENINKTGLRYTEGAAKWEQKCWAELQMSGQGPYFGQRAWFVLYHPEKNLTSCLDRYGNEIKRVMGVIDSHLKKSGRPYLCGDQCSYADVMFVPWHWLLTQKPYLMGEDFVSEWQKEYPTCWEWAQKLEQRPAVNKAREARSQAMSG
ncbi:hypothetical protein LTR97_005277 [Elasticomyces elasticus]|uniref:Glutathione S-transferase n=1 Tax=Elasticomyces elasticus TaxID=574655 RepID=A0AAN7W6V2_9PEZI|nr:hypothetical protein LTR97_005277 [Elasticomyces elasticus]